MFAKNLALSLLALSLSGCNDLFDSYRAPNWALVNKPKVQSAVGDSIRQLNPYPEELDQGYQEAKQDYENTNQQVSELKRSGMQRCMSLKSGQDKQSLDPLQPIPIQAYSASSLGYGATPEVRACIQNLEKDQLILDLKAKAQSFSLLEQKRREHDRQVYKITEDTIDAAIASYAQAHGFDLIITNEPSIAYNREQQVLDVTSGIIELIAHPDPAQ